MPDSTTQIKKMNVLYAIDELAHVKEDKFIEKLDNLYQTITENTDGKLTTLADAKKVKNLHGKLAGIPKSTTPGDVAISSIRKEKIIKKTFKNALVSYSGSSDLQALETADEKKIKEVLDETFNAQRQEGIELFEYEKPHKLQVTFWFAIFFASAISKFLQYYLFPNPNDADALNTLQTTSYLLLQSFCANIAFSALISFAHWRLDKPHKNTLLKHELPSTGERVIKITVSHISATFIFASCAPLVKVCVTTVSAIIQDMQGVKETMDVLQGLPGFVANLLGTFVAATCLATLFNGAGLALPRGFAQMLFGLHSLLLAAAYLDNSVPYSPQAIAFFATLLCTCSSKPGRDAALDIGKGIEKKFGDGYDFARNTVSYVCNLLTSRSTLFGCCSSNSELLVNNEVTSNETNHYDHNTLSPA